MSVKHRDLLVALCSSQIKAVEQQRPVPCTLQAVQLFVLVFGWPQELGTMLSCNNPLDRVESAFLKA